MARTSGSQPLYVLRIRLQKLKQKTWVLIVLARFLMLLTVLCCLLLAA